MYWLVHCSSVCGPISLLSLSVIHFLRGLFNSALSISATWRQLVGLRINDYSGKDLVGYPDNTSFSASV
jgi:hypothetical protein